MPRSLGLVALSVGLLLGLVPVLYAAGPPLDLGGLVFLGFLLLFALLPYAVFAGVHRSWERSFAIAVLAVVALLHLAATLWTIPLLDEDSLNGLLFFYPGPLLAAGLGVVAALHRLRRRRARVG